MRAKKHSLSSVFETVLSETVPGEKRVYTTTVAPLLFRSVARPRGHRAKTSMVYTLFLGKQGKRVYTIGPEKMGIHHRASDPEKEKKEGFHGGGVYFFLPCVRPVSDSECTKIAKRNLSGSNATPLVSRYSCRATLVSRFSPYVFAVSHENRATSHKVSQERPCRTLLGGGGVSHLKLAMHISKNRVALQGVSQLQCRESRYTATLRAQLKRLDHLPLARVKSQGHSAERARVSLGISIVQSQSLAMEM